MLAGGGGTESADIDAGLWRHRQGATCSRMVVRGAARCQRSEDFFDVMRSIVSDGWSVASQNRLLFHRGSYQHHVTVVALALRMTLALRRIPT